MWTAAIDSFAKAGANSSYVPGATSPWVVLDRFIRDMESGSNGGTDFTAALTTICESTHAQAAFVVAEPGGRVVAKFGGETFTPQWCRELARGLAARYAGGGLWQAGAKAIDWNPPLVPAPQTAVILPVEGATQQWMVALSMSPECPLEDDDLRIIKVIWRLQDGHSRNARVHENLKDTLFGIIRCLSTAIDAKDAYTCGHSERVARIAVRLGDEMGLSRGEVSDLYLAGLLHDVGKIGIRDEVLCKPSGLTDEERRHIEEHPIIGEQIISNVSRLSYLRPAVRGHHERFDGKGYPDKLRGEAIPLSARILAVADSCDAMMSHRRYRPALLPAQIEKIFREGAGTQWDPRIVECFFACRHELYPVCQRGLGQSVYMAIERAAGDDSWVGGGAKGPRINSRFS